MSMADPSLPASNAPRVGVIAGATATGKSALALAVAERLGAVIVNADASQLYADLPILSAQPTAADRARVSHRLYGVLDGAEAGSAASWAALARREIDAATASGRLPLLVGGNGLYLRALLDGIADVPEIHAGVRAAVRALDPTAARAALEIEDAAAAARLHPADRQRTLRALEVVRATGRTLAGWQSVGAVGLSATHCVRAVVVTRDRDKVHARCAVRVEAMLGSGVLDEVATLLARGLPADRPVLRTIGVPPLATYLAGDASLAEAGARLLSDTRHYAKRQATWWRNQQPHWRRITGAPDDRANADEVSEYITHGDDR